VKRNAKQTGSGGRLRWGLLLGTVAAFLLVPAAQALAETGVAAYHIHGAGEGSGWIKGNAPEKEGGGTPLIECHYTSPGPPTGTCDGIVDNIGIEGIVVIAEADPGSEFIGWKVTSGIVFGGCKEKAASESEECAAITVSPVVPVEVTAIFAVEPTPPSNLTPPTITGTAKVGKTLTGHAGTWSGGPESFTNQWLRCNAAGEECNPIAGEVGTTYEVVEEDVGSTIRYEETATNGLGSASAQSAQTSVVPAAVGNGEAILTPERNVYGEVEETTELTSECSEELFLGYFKPGVAENYSVPCLVVATSTGEESSLTASDESNEGAGKTGHLKNSDHPTTYWLAQALKAQATDLDGLGESSSTGFGVMEPSHTLLNYGAPVSADDVEVEFNQPIAAQDPLRTGVYQKVITLTLKQENP
jgi:hypothetical protein